MPAAADGPDLIDTHHHRADPIVELDGLQPNPEIAPRDPAMGFKSSRDPADRRARNDKNTSHPLDSHANRFAGGSEGEAPLVAGSQPHAEFDSGVYLTTAQAAPAAANQRHRPKRRGGSAVLGGNHDRQRAEIRNDRCKRDRRNILAIKSQQRDVGCVIASGDAGGRVVPSASLTETSPSSANASSAVTIRPGFQTKPEARKRCECTETIAGFVRATSSARAEENEERMVALGSVMAGTPGLFDPIWEF